MKVTANPLWPHLYLAYEQRVPNHPGKATVMRLLLRAVSRLRPRPFAWRMRNGARVAISPIEGLMPFDTVGWTCLRTGVFGLRVERCLRELLGPGDVALDVGANLGYYTAVMAQAVGPSGHVHSFEPLPPTFQRLRLVPELNGFDHVRVLPLALGAAAGVADMSYEPRNTGWATLHAAEHGPDPATASVEIRTLDSLVAAGEVPLPDVIKIDVEGHELEVLRGALRTIAKSTPAIVFELNEASASRAGWSIRDVHALLSGWGYEFAVIEEDRLAPIDPTRYVLEPGDFVDVLATTASAPASRNG